MRCIFFGILPCVAAVAYHLALQGFGHEVVLLEQDRFVLLLFFCLFIQMANENEINLSLNIHSIGTELVVE